MSKVTHMLIIKTFEAQMLARYYAAAIYGHDSGLLAEATAQKLCFMDDKDVEGWV